jgi:peptide/nickel transport system substrate-binding protein
MSGGKVVHFDRAEWLTIPDSATAAAALQAGEIDWWENVQFDLIETLKRRKELTVATSDPGYTNFLRFNCGTEPFNNVALRRAVAAGIDQGEFTQSLVGSDPSLQHTCFAMYSCGQPGVEELGKSLMAGKNDFKALAEDVKKAGYNGEKIILLNTADLFQLAPMAPVLFDTLQKMGMNVEMQSLDLSSLVARRASQAPVSAGGWSMFLFLTSTANLVNPVVDVVARGLGPNGYPGNYSDPELEDDIAGWIAATNDQDRVRISTSCMSGCGIRCRLLHSAVMACRRPSAPT